MCSKEWVIRQYDHEVQGASVLKPLVGEAEDGPGDAAIIKPVATSSRGLIISNGINTRYGDVNPYWMAASAIDEALRQVIAVGGSLKQAALLDNFCWGSVKDKQSLGALVKASQACYDMSLAYGTPFISGKDSLNNEFEHEGKRISIPHTLLISAMAVMEDAVKGRLHGLQNRPATSSTSSERPSTSWAAPSISPDWATSATIPRWSDPQTARKLMDSLSAATSHRPGARLPRPVGGRAGGGPGRDGLRRGAGGGGRV